MIWSLWRVRLRGDLGTTLLGGRNGRRGTKPKREGLYLESRMEEVHNFLAYLSYSQASKGSLQIMGGSYTKLKEINFCP